MKRQTATVASLVRRAVEICDPEDRDPALGRFEARFEDDDEPVTAVENLEELLAIAAEGSDYQIENPAVSMATAVVIYLARRPSETANPSNPTELLQLAARAQWHGRPPREVSDWLALRGVKVHVP